MDNVLTKSVRKHKGAHVLTTDSLHQQILKYKDHATFSVTILETHTRYIGNSFLWHQWYHMDG